MDRRLHCVLCCATALLILLPICACEDSDSQAPPIIPPVDEPDETPPSAVTNLSVATTADRSVTLNWSAPGDDWTAGRATTYDIRHAPAESTLRAWADAVPLGYPLVPESSGRPEALEITELDSGQLYYLGLKTADEAGNWSILSNVVSARTTCGFTVTKPEWNQYYCASETIEFRWTVPPCAGDSVSVRIFNGEGIGLWLVSAATENDGLLSWDLPELDQDIYGCTVRILDLETGMEAVNEGSFSVRRSCEVMIGNPYGGDEFCLGARVRGYWYTEGCCRESIAVELLHDGELVLVFGTSDSGHGFYDWSIPYDTAPDDGYQIQVRGLDSEFLLASTAPFTVLPGDDLQLIAPEAGDVYTNPASIPIVWDAGQCHGDQIRVVLLNSADEATTLAPDTANDGSFYWQVPAGYDPGGGFRIRLIDLETGIEAVSAAPFTMEWVCQVSVTEPQYYQEYCEGDLAQIEWETSPWCAGTMRIELYKEGELDWVLGDGEPDDGSFTWVVPAVPESWSYHFRVVNEESGAWGLNNGSISFGNGCYLQLLTPNIGGSYQAGDPVAVEWNYGECCGETVTISLLRLDVECRVLATDVPLSDQVFTWTAEQCDGQVSGYKIRITENRLGTSDTSFLPFTIFNEK